MGNIIDIDIAVAGALIQKELGRTFSGQPETVMLHTSDLSDIAGTPDSNIAYFGKFDMYTFDAIKLSIMAASYIETAIADKIVIDNTPSAPPVSTGHLIWNNIEAIALGSDGLVQFSGYKFNLKTQWDIATLGSLSNGAGWAIASGINVHSSGTTEAAYGYAFEAKHYRLTIDFTGITTGSCDIETDAVSIGTVSADGVQVFEFDGDITDTTLYLVPSTDFDGGYDTATIKLEVFNKY